MKKPILFLLFSFLLMADELRYEQMLLGTHKLSLQWISWERFGKATITKKNNTITISGEQRIKGDYLQIHGTISDMKPKSFIFDGEIITKVNHIANGAECRREGKMEFKITKRRRYWRLQAMQNPCDDVVDYVDIFFK